MDYFLEEAKREEARFLRMESVDWVIKREYNAALSKLGEKVPPKVEAALMNAFTIAFNLVFETGVGELAVGKEAKRKRKLAYIQNENALRRRFSKGALSSFDKESKIAGSLNSLLGALEGGALGILGVGVPDVPVLIALLLKTIYEIAMSYGFHYETNEERCYILSLIDLIFSDPGEKRLLNEKLDSISCCIDEGRELSFDLVELKGKVSARLTRALLVSKFVQSVPVVGLVGGLSNWPILAKSAKYAKIKYKKRFLVKKSLEEKR